MLARRPWTAQYKHNDYSRFAHPTIPWVGFLLLHILWCNWCPLAEHHSQVLARRPKTAQYKHCDFALRLGHLRCRAVQPSVGATSLDRAIQALYFSAGWALWKQNAYLNSGNCLLTAPFADAHTAISHPIRSNLFFCLF